MWGILILGNFCLSYTVLVNAQSETENGLLEKYLNFGWRKKKQAYMAHQKPNHPQSSLLVTPLASTRGAVIVGNILGKPLLEWCSAWLSLQS